MRRHIPHAFSAPCTAFSTIFATIHAPPHCRRHRPLPTRLSPRTIPNCPPAQPFHPSALTRFLTRFLTRTLARARTRTGDAYMIVSGHDGVGDHAARMLRMAAAMLGAVEDMRGYDGRELQVRSGLGRGGRRGGRRGCKIQPKVNQTKLKWGEEGCVCGCVGWRWGGGRGCGLGAAVAVVCVCGTRTRPSRQTPCDPVLLSCSLCESIMIVTPAPAHTHHRSASASTPARRTVVWWG
mgnify:CR=1 FL=1